MKPLRLLTIVVLSWLAACHKSGSPGPSILKLRPQQGAAGIPLTISGLHFDTVLSHTTVKFNGVVAKIGLVTDSSLVALVPAGATTGKVTVTVNGNTATSPTDFIILPGGWVQKADVPTTLPGNGRTLGIGFAIGNYGYVGSGGENGAVFHDLNRYDPSVDAWTPKAPMPLNMFAAVCMVIHNKAYVGMGVDFDSSHFISQFYEYDPATDVWTKKADFPGTKRGYEFGLAIGDTGYVGLGHDDKGNALFDIWKYDPSTDKWSQKSDFPHNYNVYPINMAAMTIDNKIGYLGGNAVGNDAIKLWWQYDPVKDLWTQKNNIPGYDMYAPSTMVINGKGYLAGGGFENWQYNESSDTWTPMAFFAVREAGAAFVINNTGYFGSGYAPLGPGAGSHVDFWQFTP